jgi:hypothetical protein
MLSPFSVQLLSLVLFGFVQAPAIALCGGTSATASLLASRSTFASSTSARMSTPPRPVTSVRLVLPLSTSVSALT